MMRASLFPSKVRVVQEIGDPEWSHTLILEDRRGGGELRAYLNQDIFTALWRAIESPESIIDDDSEVTDARRK